MKEKRENPMISPASRFAFIVLAAVAGLAVAACEGVTNTGNGGGGSGGDTTSGEGGADTAAPSADTGQPPVCEPDCAGKDCGDDGCGGSCGGCAEGENCEYFQCVAPEACTFAQVQENCLNRECGGDGCGGICGSCGAAEECALVTGLCECRPDCGALLCGVDPVCGESCGECAAGEECRDGTCEKLYPAGPYGTEVGDTIANLTFYTAEGRAVDLKSLFGKEKVIILGSAAGWCSVCRDEAVEFQDFYELYDDKGLILIVTLFEDDRGNPITGSYVNSWVDYFDLTYPVYQDKIEDGQFALQSFYDENATPLNMVITTADMKIRYRAVGYSAFQVNYWAKKFMFE